MPINLPSHLDSLRKMNDVEVLDIVSDTYSAVKETIDAYSLQEREKEDSRERCHNCEAECLLSYDMPNTSSAILFKAEIDLKGIRDRISIGINQRFSEKATTTEMRLLRDSGIEVLRYLLYMLIDWDKPTNSPHFIQRSNESRRILFETFSLDCSKHLEQYASSHDNQKGSGPEILERTCSNKDKRK